MAEDYKQDYNTFEEYPSMSYNIISYLVDNNEMIWKLLKHSHENAWKESDLTKAEKGALIYNGGTGQTDYRVFLDGGQDDSWTKEACFLRVPVLEVIPTNYVYGYVTMGFEIYCHHKVNTLSNYTTRVDTIAQQILATLNGESIGGVGRMYFDYRSNARTRVTTIGSVPYRGKAVLMCNWISSKS